MEYNLLNCEFLFCTPKVYIISHINYTRYLKIPGMNFLIKSDYETYSLLHSEI